MSATLLLVLLFRGRAAESVELEFLIVLVEDDSRELEVVGVLAVEWCVDDAMLELCEPLLDLDEMERELFLAAL